MALYRLGDAIRSGDPARVEGKVDWPRVRQGMKDDVDAAVASKASPESDNPLEALGALFAGKVAGAAIDAAVTPSGLALLMETGRSAPSVAQAVAPAMPEIRKDKPLPKLVSSHFPGVGIFEAEIQPRNNADHGRPLRIRFELEDGYWMLTRVYLPI